MNDDLYNVDKYTDEQLYNILDINNPTDRELEAKILSLIRKYKNIQNESGDRLAFFFENIYKRFFETDADDIQEGFTPAPSGTPIRTNSRVIEEDNRIEKTRQDIASVQTFEYSKDKLQINPLIKQTITRVISIDSQYRDKKTNPFSTDFTFDLSEPLRDVVSLKLYSIQIPYTWYTISKSYGSNFFYISSIYDDTYNYKVEIAPGTYTSTELIDTINAKFADISNNEASEINFNGETLLSYNSNTSKTTLNLNIQNTFNESYYSFQFPVVTDINNSIANYMGFNNTTYHPYRIYSNQTYFLTTNNTDNEKKENFVLDSSNNFFTVVQYITNTTTGTVTTLNNLIIQLKNSNGAPYTGNVSRTDIINIVNAAIQSSGYFESSSGIKSIINAATGYTCFELNLIFNRKKIKYIPNSKMQVIFQSEVPKPNQYFQQSPSETFTIWNKSPAKYNCFYFDNSINPFSTYLSENLYKVSDINVDISTNIFFRCNTFGYQTVNDFSLNIPSNTYTLPRLIDQINSILINYNGITNIFNTNNTIAFLDSTNRFNLNIDITKYFVNKNYKVIIDDSSVLQISATNQNNSFSSRFESNGDPGTIIRGNISYNPGNSGYKTDKTHLFTVVPFGTDGNQNAPHMVVPLKKYNGTTIYPNTETFISFLNQSILDFSINIVDISDTQYPFIGSSMTYTINNLTNRLDISLNMQCNYYLSESNFDIFFTDVSNGPLFNWSDLKINYYYRLHNQQTATNVYASIIGNSTVTTNSINITNDNNMIVIRTDNPNVPQHTIQFNLTPGTYTITELYAELNRQFINDPNTIGSTIGQKNGFTELFVNINRIYTTADFKLVFYNAVTFTGCFSGIKSVQNTSWDTTIGWILGFRDYSEYYLNASNVVANTNNPDAFYYLTSTDGLYIYNSIINSAGQLVNTIVSLTGDTTLNTNLFNYFLISLDDYIQNHLNDGLVTISQNQKAIQNPDYSYTSRLKCDPGTNSLFAAPIPQSNTDNMTLAQLYSLNQSILSNKTEIKKFSPGPFIKDLFGIIPMKIPSKTGDMFVEYGGTLQNQTRVYFGPVNIRKMTIQLLNDRGGLVDLNNNNWTFSFVCEQLYRSSSAET